MNHYSRWTVIAGAVVLAAVVGAIAYNIGFDDGIEQSGKIVSAHPGQAGPYPYYGHRWHGPPWVFFPLFAIAVWFLVVRALCWRGHGPRERLDEWHRQAHERMSNG
jgi:hypothetical protein